MNAKIGLPVFLKNFQAYFADAWGYVLLSFCVVGLLVLSPASPAASYLDPTVAEVLRALLWITMLLSILSTVWAEDDPSEVERVLRTSAGKTLEFRARHWLGKYLAGAALWTIGGLIGAWFFGIALGAAFGAKSAALNDLIPRYLVYYGIGLVLLALGLCTSPVLRAVFRRNFAGYFVNPLGYVFIIVFVSLSTWAAFWPNEFFNANLCNLDQLGVVFPAIMLIFVPAITMGIWSDERRQGTDELLLTVPSRDFDVVLGKYLAAVAIFSVSLLYSLLCTFLWLRSLGEPDTGLFFATYFGYWLVGVAMLAVGMIASFMTSNLTVAFVLGALLNVPLVAAVFADAILPADAALQVKFWSYSERLEEFGRGIVSSQGVVFFGAILAVMLYMSMVFIGRRHWPTGEARFSGGLFYSILHGLWLASFATLFFTFQGNFAYPLWFLVILALGYLLLHLVFLWVWSEYPNRQPLSWIHSLIPITQVVALAAFAVITVRFPGAVAGSGAYWTLLAIYLLITAGLAVLWGMWPRAVSLMPGHYFLRFLALVVLALGVNVVFLGFNPRWDLSEERISSLSAKTVELLGALDPKKPVQIEAFISPRVPEDYIATRANLLNMLREIEARGKNVRLTINPTERFSEQAERAEKRYDITPRRVTTIARGRMTEEHLFMGVAFTSGLQKVTVPFIDRGIPVEYELVRSISTVTEQKRKKVGVLTTDAQLYGRFSMGGGGSNRWPIIDELEKQYEVVQVDAAQPITKETCDVLVAVQPSSLGPEQMPNFIAAVTDGMPTAIFEDPFPFFDPSVPGTKAPRRPPQQMMMMGQPPMEKGDIKPLWDQLGVEYDPEVVVWQLYNPYPKIPDFNRMPEFVFIDKASGAAQPFNRSEGISSGLQTLLFPFPGSIGRRHTSDLKFVPLVFTGTSTGTVKHDDILEMSFFGPSGLNPARPRTVTQMEYVLAARIHGKLPKPAADPPAEKKDEAAKPADVAINVVLVPDIDMLHEAFFRLREVGEIRGSDIRFDFDNVTMVLNILDTLAGDQRFVDLRNRRPAHRTLTRIQSLTEEARRKTAESRQAEEEKVKKLEEDVKKSMEDRLKKLREQIEKQNLSDEEIASRVDLLQEDLQRRMDIQLVQARRERDRKINRIETELSTQIDRLQSRYKGYGLVLPVLPLLLVAIVVFFVRRAGELEGVSRRRMRG